MPATRNTFDRLRGPDRRETAEGGAPRASASRRAASAVALPSAAGLRTLMWIPPASRDTPGRDALGDTRTEMEHPSPRPRTHRSTGPLYQGGRGWGQPW